MSETYTTIEKLNRIRLANKIIDHGPDKVFNSHKTIINTDFPNPKIEKLRHITKIIKEEKVKEITKGISKEINQEPIAIPRTKKKTFPWIFVLIFAFALIMFCFALKPKEDNLSLNKISREIFISSGNFASEEEAKKARKQLGTRLEVPLTIIQSAHTWIIKIGPTYSNHEDALLVLDELDKYGIEDLALRFQK